MVESFVLEIAGGVATGAVNTLVERGSLPARRLLDLLGSKPQFSSTGSGADKGELEGFGGWSAEEVARQLTASALHDPRWADALRAAWAEVRPEIVAHEAHEGSTTNVVSGSIDGKIVQARDVEGGIFLS